MSAAAGAAALPPDVGDVVEVDIAIVGAGPTGLYGAYCAGFRGLEVAVIDSLPELGGQISALYPEKYVYDVAGLARDTQATAMRCGTICSADQNYCYRRVKVLDHMQCHGKAGGVRC